jgi:hypothetical protein
MGYIKYIYSYTKIKEQLQSHILLIERSTTKVIKDGHNHVMQLIWRQDDEERERDTICYCHKPVVQRWTTPSSSW